MGGQSFSMTLIVASTIHRRGSLCARRPFLDSTALYLTCAAILLLESARLADGTSPLNRNFAPSGSSQSPRAASVPPPASDLLVPPPPPLHTTRNKGARNYGTRLGHLARISYARCRCIAHNRHHEHRRKRPRQVRPLHTQPLCDNSREHD